SITLVGDGIENPWNALTMIHAAGMFGGECLFRDRQGLAGTWQETLSLAEQLRLISPVDLAARYAPIVALDNLDGAAPVHGLRLGPGPQPAVVAGNERTGIARDIQSMATD